MRWVADDGRSWPGNSTGRARLEDMPFPVAVAIRAGTAVTDRALNLQISHDGNQWRVK